MKLKNVFLFITLATLTLGQSAANAAASSIDFGELFARAFLDASTYKTWKNNGQCSLCPSFFTFLKDTIQKEWLADLQAWYNTSSSNRSSSDTLKILQRFISNEHCRDVSAALQKKEDDAFWAKAEAFWAKIENAKKQQLKDNEQNYFEQTYADLRFLLYAGTAICVIVFRSDVNAYRAHSALIRDMRFNHDASEELCRTKIGVFKISLERAANFFADNAQRNGATSKDLMPRKLKLKYTPIREILAYADITKENKIAADATFQELQETVQQNKRITINRMFLSGACLGLCVCALIFVFVQ